MNAPEGFWNSVRHIKQCPNCDKNPNLATERLVAGHGENLTGYFWECCGIRTVAVYENSPERSVATALNLWNTVR